MIAWAIEAARSSALFDHIVVSTEDPDVARIAREAGADVPFVRPASLADDATSTDAVLLHALGECERAYGDVEFGCCIYPTVPFLTTEALARGLALLRNEHAAACFPVVRYDFPIEQAFTLHGAHPRPEWPDKLLARSQDLPEHYHDAGMFYWVDASRFLADPRIFNAQSVAFIISPDEAQDINTPEDWARAELKLAILRARGR